MSETIILCDIRVQSIRWYLNQIQYLKSRERVLSVLDETVRETKEFESKSSEKYFFIFFKKTTNVVRITSKSAPSKHHAVGGTSWKFN